MEARKNRSWYPDEDAQLIREHKYGKHDFSKIAKIHKRSSEEIVKRLRRLGIIKSEAPVVVVSGQEIPEVTNHSEVNSVYVEHEEAVEPVEPVLKEEPVLFLTKLSEYINAGAPWTTEETELLIERYSDKMFDLMTISALHKRTPNSIICKLRKLDIEKDQASVRGFSDYKSSDLFKEVALVKKQNRKLN
jgi:hypothetical protein